MSLQQNASIPHKAGAVLDVPYGSNTIRRGDFVKWSSGNGAAAAVGVASDTAATLDADGIGIAMDGTGETDSRGRPLNPTSIRVARRGLVWVKKNDTAVATRGQYANPTALATATAPSTWTATSTAANAIGRIVDAVAGWMLIDLIGGVS